MSAQTGLRSRSIQKSGIMQEDSITDSSRSSTRSSSENVLFSPTKIQLRTIGIFGLTVLLASLGSEFMSDQDSSQASIVRSRYSANSNMMESASFSSSAVLPYFANKRNIFNQYFVKKSWGWTTLALVVLLVITTTANSKQSKRIQRSNQRPGGLIIRWAFATFWWLLVTAWFFGPSLTNRVLIWSGAQCQTKLPTSNNIIADDQQVDGTSTITDTAFETLVIEPEICLGHVHDTKISRKDAYWSGGHDISGHTFLLTLSSLLLITMLERNLLGNEQKRLGSNSNNNNKSDLISLFNVWQKLSVLIIIGLIVLWWWMALMTSLFFHHPQEKLSGFALGVFGWWISEILIRLIKIYT